MRLVIADTGPINYLILIGHIELLPRLIERVVLPGAVRAELSNPLAPPPVQRWIATPPTWLEVIETQGLEPVEGLHEGEAAAIALAASLHADPVLIDERRAVRSAERRGLRVTGTLGVLDLGAERGLPDFAEAIRLLEATSFLSSSNTRGLEAHDDHQHRTPSPEHPTGRSPAAAKAFRQG